MQPCSIVRTAGTLVLWIVILVLTQLTAYGQNRSPTTDTPPSSGGTVALDDYTIALQPWKGDYDGMVQRRMVRIAVPYSMTHYFLDGAVERGISAAMGRRLERVINQKEGLRTRLVHIVFDPVCGHGLALEHNGDLYACDHFVEPDYLRGNILDRYMRELAGSDAQIKFGQDQRDALPRFFFFFYVRFACHGECPKNRFLTTPDGESGLNNLCAGYQSFFHHADRSLRILAGSIRRGLPAAEIM